MGNKHLKTTHLEISGTPVTEPNAIYEAYEKGVFPYQFRNEDGSYSRLMRCSSASELLWLTEQVKFGGSTVLIGESSPV